MYCAYANFFKISVHIFKVLIIPISLIKKRNRKSRKSGKYIRKIKKNRNTLVIMINISKLSSPKTNIRLNFKSKHILLLQSEKNDKAIFGVEKMYLIIIAGESMDLHRLFFFLIISFPSLSWQEVFF